MKNRQKQLDDSHKIAAICFAALILVLFYAVLAGCTAEPCAPEDRTISGVYQSVPYENHPTYNIKLEILQDGDQLFGTVVKDGQKFNVWGRIEGYIVIVDGGFFDLNLAYNGTKAYPLAGNITWEGEQRALRLELISKIHNQGGVR